MVVAKSRGGYGDFKTIELRAAGYTTRKNTYQTLSKHLRSSPGSTVHPRSARAKAVQKVHIDASRWRAMTHDLARACELSSASNAAAQSTLNPDTDPTRLQPTACTYSSWHLIPTASKVPTATICDNWPRGSPSAAQGNTRCPGVDVRSKRTATVRPDHPRRLAHRPSTRSPPGSPWPLDWPPATPGGSRPQVEVYKSILNVLRRGGQ